MEIVITLAKQLPKPLPFEGEGNWTGWFSSEILKQKAKESE